MKTTDIANPGLLSPKAAKHAFRGTGHPNDGGGFSKLVRANEPTATARTTHGECIETVDRHVANHDDALADLTQPDAHFAGRPESSNGSDIRHDRPAPAREPAVPAGEESEIMTPNSGRRRHDVPNASDADADPSTGTPAAIVTPPDLQHPQRHDSAKRSQDTPAEAGLSTARSSTRTILNGKNDKPKTDAAAPPIGFARGAPANAPAENRPTPTFAGNTEQSSHHDADRRPVSLGPASRSSTPETTAISTGRATTRQALAEPASAETHPVPSSTRSSQPIPDHHVDRPAPSPSETATSAAHRPAMAATTDGPATDFIPAPRMIARSDRRPTPVQTSVQTSTPSLSPSKSPGPTEAPTQSDQARTAAVIDAAPRADWPTKGPEAPAHPQPAAAARPTSPSAPASNETVSAGLEPQAASTDVDGKAAADMSRPGRPAAPALPRASAIATAMATAGKELPPTPAPHGPISADLEPQAISTDIGSDVAADMPHHRRLAAPVLPTATAIATPIATTGKEPLPAPASNGPISAGPEPQTASTDIDSKAAADMPRPSRPTGPVLPTAPVTATTMVAGGNELPPASAQSGPLSAGFKPRTASTYIGSAVVADMPHPDRPTGPMFPTATATAVATAGKEAQPAPASTGLLSVGLEPRTASTDIVSRAAADMPRPGRPAVPALPTTTTTTVATAGKEAQPILLVGETLSDAADRQPDLPSYRPAAAQMPAKDGAQIVSAKSEPATDPTVAVADEPVRLATRTSVQPTTSVPPAPAKEPEAPIQAARPIQPGASAAASGTADPSVETSSPSFAVELTAAAARYANRQSARGEETYSARTFDSHSTAPPESPQEAGTFAPRKPSRAPLPAMMWRGPSPASAATVPDTQRQALRDEGQEHPISNAGKAVKRDDAAVDAADIPDTNSSTRQNVGAAPAKVAEITPQTASPPLAVASAILSEPTWRPTAVAQTTQSLSVRTTPVLKTLQVQLNPEHLGMVTATLSMSGTQLTVELSVTTREAHDRLKGEEQVIEKAVRSLGYDVGQVSIIQSSVVQNAPPRTDATMPQPMAQGRDQPAGGMASGDGGNRSGNQQGGRHEGNASGAFSGAAARDADRRGGGVYI